MSQLTNNQVYKITNRNSGMVLAVEGANQNDGARVIQQPWQSGLEQQWRAIVIDANNDIYQFVNLSSSKVMAISQASKDNGGPVIQFTNQTGPEQKFQLFTAGGVTTGGGGWLWIMSVNSGKYVSIAQASKKEGIIAEQWQLGTTDEYRFAFGDV